MNRNNNYLKNNQFAKGSSPNKTSFKKGHIPWNKNKKGIHVSPKTEFKNGHRSKRWKPVGTITTRKDKSGTVRRWIKIKEPNIWIEYAKYIWLKSGRKFQRGFCLHHINLDSSDDRLDNLCLISRKDHPKIHNRWNTKNNFNKFISRERLRITSPLL